MLQIRRNRKRLDSFVRKLLGEEMAEPLAELLMRQLPRPTLEFPADKFQPVRLGTPKALNSQSQPLLGVISNGQHSPRQIESLGPKMKQRLRALSSDFPG
jgi:hypothetical protein